MADATGEPPAVPLLDLRAQYAQVRERVEAAMRRVVESQHFVLGPEVEAFEAEIAAYCGARFGVGCASGSDALYLALDALGVGPGDEVVCPSYTFFATGGAVTRLGARPLFCDIDPASYDATAATMAEAAGRGRRVRALLPVHLFGRAAEMEPILALGRELGAPVLEDAAQAIGALDAQGARAGARGAGAALSFFPTKNLGAYGDAGLVTTSDPELAARMRRQRVHGMDPKYYHESVGVNSRLDALQAAVLRAKLPFLESWTEARRRNAAWYDRAFAKAGAVPSTERPETGDLPLATPAPAPEGARHVYNQYVVRVPARLRDGLRAHLAERGIGSEIYYPLGLHEQVCFAELGYDRGALPETESAARETLALPVYPELSEAQLEHVVRTATSFLRG